MVVALDNIRRELLRKVSAPIDVIVDNSEDTILLEGNGYAATILSRADIFNGDYLKLFDQRLPTFMRRMPPKPPAYDFPFPAVAVPDTLSERLRGMLDAAGLPPFQSLPEGEAISRDWGRTFELYVGIPCRNDTDHVAHGWGSVLAEFQQKLQQIAELANGKITIMRTAPEADIWAWRRPIEGGRGSWDMRGASEIGSEFDTTWLLLKAYTRFAVGYAPLKTGKPGLAYLGLQA